LRRMEIEINHFLFAKISALVLDVYKINFNQVTSENGNEFILVKRIEF